MNKIVLSLSGGLDSSTLMGLASARGLDIIPIFFDYGSKHNQHELAAATMIARHYLKDIRLVRLFDAMATSGIQSALLQSSKEEIPEGHYEAESMKSTVVPGRNMIFASFLTGIAISEGAAAVWLGIHAGDHAIYPDCRPEWFHAMDQAVRAASEAKVALNAPFLNEDKSFIVNQGKYLQVPYELTRTCYKSQYVACGKCGSCQERLAAFAANNTEDPIEYDTDCRVLLPK